MEGEERMAESEGEKKPEAPGMEELSLDQEQFDALERDFQQARPLLGQRRELRVPDGSDAWHRCVQPLFPS
jgi:hypothetical protein